ncbi:MAG: hypothetical protein Q4D02_00265 [Clostridia bacterium]|nr:hypothetical protein [Clostridia bacterium]
MTRVFWLSRHTMTDVQLSDLKRIYGDVEIVQYSGSVRDAAEVLELAGDCEVLAVVLPPAILANLVNPRVNTRPVIRAKANRVATGNTVINPATGKEEEEFRFEHAGWEQIKRIIVETVDL